MTEWIPYNEKNKPQRKEEEDDGVYSKDYLITDGENIGIGYFEFEYFSEDHPEDDPEITGITYSSECWHDWTSLLNSGIDGWPMVTHWAKLPELPTQK